MTSLIYKYISSGLFSDKPMFLLSKIKSALGESSIMFLLPPSFSGKIALGKRTFELKDGSCKIEKAKLEEGVLSPCLICKNKTYSLSPFLFEESEVSRISSSETDFDKILTAITKLDEKNSKLEKSILLLEEQVKNKELFTFS